MHNQPIPLFSQNAKIPPFFNKWGKGNVKVKRASAGILRQSLRMTE